MIRTVFWLPLEGKLSPPLAVVTDEVECVYDKILSITEYRVIHIRKGQDYFARSTMAVK